MIVFDLRSMLQHLLTTLLLFTSIVRSNAEVLEVIESNRICTKWMLVNGQLGNLDIDTALCSGDLVYDLQRENGGYIVRFCCPYQRQRPSGCGRSLIDPIRNRIVGGREAAAHSWPWIVSLQYKGSHFCGGTLIDESHVLTAAHCLQDDTMDFSQLTAVAGLHRRSNANAGTVQRRRVARFFNHEQYNHMKTENDVAIIRLASPMIFDSFVNVACLPGTEAELHESVMIAGWGTMSYGGRSSDALLQANVMIMNTCRYVYDFDSTKQICAGTYDYSKDACQGDSGGPLMKEADGRWYVNGIVSYGEECAKKDHPGVYVRVSAYLPWIRSKIAS